MKKNDYMIRLETPNDYRKVENLTREAFWSVYRPGCMEHYVLHRSINGRVMEKHCWIIPWKKPKEKLKLPGQLV